MSPKSKYIIGSSRRHLWVGGLIGLFAITVSWAQPLRLDGSELLGAPVEQLLAAQARDTGLELRVRFAGSRPARDRLAAEAVDVAVLVDDPSADPYPEDWVSMPLAHVSAQIVVPRGLSIEQLSYDDLAKIFSAESSVATPRWGDFGAAGRWANVPVTPHVVTAAGGLGHEIFVHLALPTTRLKPSVLAHDTLESALEAVKDEEGGIAVVPWLPTDREDLKTLLVAPGMDAVAFGPSWENMNAGDYPLAVPLRLVFPRDLARQRLAWFQSWYRDEMSAALQESELAPLPRSARNQQVFDLESIAAQP